jgi:hypothetical protein
MIPLVASSMAQEETSQISEDENILDKGIESAKRLLKKERK